jgi:hypothetical protein
MVAEDNGKGAFDLAVGKLWFEIKGAMPCSWLGGEGGYGQ